MHTEPTNHTYQKPENESSASEDDESFRHKIEQAIYAIETSTAWDNHKKIHVLEQLHAVLADQGGGAEAEEPGPAN